MSAVRPEAAVVDRDAACLRRAADEGRLMLSVLPGRPSVLHVRPGGDRPTLATMTWEAFAKALADEGGVA